MGNKFDHHHHHNHLFHQKTIFLPIFCRLSIKDITLNHRRKDLTLSDEPSSPKVSCMGQVKRNNRVIAFPSATAAAVTTHSHKYSKLRKLFSSKSLLPPTTSSVPAAAAAVAGGRSGSKSCRSSREVCVKNIRRLKMEKEAFADVGELDPPLPVVKKAPPPPGVGGDDMNLWKRRFNGTALGGLQIQQIHLPNSNKSQLPTV